MNIYVKRRYMCCWNFISTVGKFINNRYAFEQDTQTHVFIIRDIIGIIFKVGGQGDTHQHNKKYRGLW